MMQEIGEEFDAGVALDDIVFTECSLRPPQDECRDSEFHCTETKVHL